MNSDTKSELEAELAAARARVKELEQLLVLLERMYEPQPNAAVEGADEPDEAA